MNIFILGTLLFFIGLVMIIFSITILLLSKEGLKFMKAKLFRTPLLFILDPVIRSFSVKETKNTTLYEDKNNTHFLGGHTAYKYGGTPVFLAVKDHIPAIDAYIAKEIQKAMNSGITTFEQLQEVIKKSLLEERTEEVVVNTSEGPKKTVRKYFVLKPLHGVAHKVVDIRIRPAKKGKGMDVKVEVEAYEPVDIEGIVDFYGRNFSSTAVKKLIDFRDLMWAEKTMKVYEKIKSLKKPTLGGGGFSPIWLVYLGIFVFIIFMALKMGLHPSTPATAKTPPAP